MKQNKNKVLLFEKKMVYEETGKSEYEQCILCKKKTTDLKQENITERKYYIEGAGQLCKTCYFKTYG